jgi:hypothetical protein
MLLLALALSLAASDLAVVAIVDRPKPRSSLDAASLGWIDFRAPGKPSNTVTVSTAVITRLLADGRWGGRPIRDFPPNFRARFVKQALARGVAHELGHYLLRSSAHASHGLMRPRLTVFDMVVPGPISFVFCRTRSSCWSAEQRPVCWLKCLRRRLRSQRPLQARAAITSRSAGVQAGRVVLRRKRPASSGPTLISERPESRSDSFGRALVSTVG